MSACQTFPFISRNVAALCSIILYIVFIISFHFYKGWRNQLRFRIISPCVVKAVTVLHILQCFTKRCIFVKLNKYKVRQQWDNSQSSGGLECRNVNSDFTASLGRLTRLKRIRPSRSSDECSTGKRDEGTTRVLLEIETLKTMSSRVGSVKKKKRQLQQHRWFSHK